MRLGILIVALLFSFNIYAQKIQILKKAHNLYQEEQYSEAMKEYEKLWNSKSGAKILGVDGKMNLANCYRINERPFLAEKLYVKVLPYFKDRVDAYLQYGQVLMLLGRYDEAVAQFERYSEMMPEDGRGQEYINQINALSDIQPIFEAVSVYPQEAINDTLSRQTGVTYFGDAIVYTSDERTTAGSESFYNMRISGIGADGNLKPSEKFSVSLNGEKRHDGPATFTRDGRIIYYSKSVTTADGSSVLQIWISTFKDGTWSEPEPLPVMFQGKNFSHPSLSGDGKQLYFASDMKGTLGGLDIWVSNFEDGRWTYPKNLGEDINTPKDEGWPYIHPDGDLFFSSKGHTGYGGYDVYRTRPLGNGVDWLDIENMSTPFNTSFNDISFIMSDDQTQGFLSSNRNRSYDIYRYVLEDQEPQKISASLGRRKSTGISEIDVHDVELDDDFPEQRNNESDEEYIDRINQQKEEDKVAATDKEDGTQEEGGSGTNTKEGEDDPTTDKEENETEKIELIVKLQVVDGFGKPLTDAKVRVKNKFVGESVTYNVNEEGISEIHLEANQKYVFTGVLDGYNESSLPVSTMGAQKTQRVAANMELKKK